jgi:hypothetical protein
VNVVLRLSGDYLGRYIQGKKKPYSAGREKTGLPKT